MKAHRGAEVQFHSLFTSALEGDNWVTLFSSCLNPWGNSSKYTLDRRLFEHHRQSGHSGKKNLFPLTEIEK